MTLHRATAGTTRLRPGRVAKCFEPVAAAANGAFVSAGKTGANEPEKPA
jgi:hypothetical protein